MIPIHIGYKRSIWRQNVPHKDKKRFLRVHLNPLSDHIRELTHREVIWNQILLFVNARYVTLIGLLHDYLPSTAPHCYQCSTKLRIYLYKSIKYIQLSN